MSLLPVPDAFLSGQYHCPWFAVYDKLGTNKPGRKPLCNASSLLIVREGIFAQAIPQQTAEQSLTCSVAAPCVAPEFGVAGTRIGRPDDIQAAP